ncbi:MAG: tetratricopeptide repeat protein [Mucilaginibacter sp.]
MKHKRLMFTVATVTFLTVLSAVAVNAQTTASSDSTRKQLEKLVASKDPADKALLTKKLYSLAASNKEQEMILAVSYFYRIKDIKTSDSVSNAEIAKFPLGIQARNVEQKPVFDEKTPQGMEVAYYKWLKKFPPENFKTGELDEAVNYDYVRSAIAQGYAKQKNSKKAIEFINMLQADFWKGNAYAGLSETFHQNGDLPLAEIYAKKAMESAESYTESKKGNSNAAKFAASGYAGLTSSYANILFEEKKYKEALQYTETAYKNSKELNPRINARYAEILMALNRNQEAFEKLQDIVKAGKATPEVADNFKKLYIKVKGSEVGFDEYTAQIHKGVIENLTKRLNKDIVSEPAAMFTLTDLQGNKVSLADLKG